MTDDGGSSDFPIPDSVRRRLNRPRITEGKNVTWNGTTAWYDIEERETARDIYEAAKEGSISQEQAKNEWDVLHALKVEVDARIIDVPGAGSGILDPKAGIEQREEAIGRVSAAAPDDWKAHALAAVRQIAERQETFTTDDVWALLDRQEIPTPPERRAMAQPIRAAEHSGWITKTDRFVPSALPWAHRRNTQVWSSNLAR